MGTVEENKGGRKEKMNDEVEATKRANVEGLNKTAKKHFEKEKVVLCNSCGKELREEDGEFLTDYEFCNELRTQYINLCKECCKNLEEPPEIIVIRDIPYEQVKKEIAEYYESLKDGEAAYPSDVSLILKLDFEQTIKAVDELIEEGVLEVLEEGK